MPPDALIIGTGLVAAVSRPVSGEEPWQRRLAQIDDRPVHPSSKFPRSLPG